MVAHSRNDVWQKLTLSHFAGNPVYFFDTAFLLSKATALAGWSPAKLEAAIGPRVEHALGVADTRYITANGFYVVFGRYDDMAAQETANEIGMGILTHLFGQGDYWPEAVQRLCRQSSVQNLVEDLGVPPPPQNRRIERQSQGYEVINFGSHAEQRDEKPFAKELTNLYREHMMSDHNDQDFQFWPCWNSQRQRITSFVCERVESPDETFSLLGSLSPATMQCRLDVVALAAASKGIQRIVRRCEPAFVSVPVHVETLLWSKARDSYLNVLMKIDSRIRALLVPTIVGFAPGANLAPITEWTARLRPHVRGISLEVDEELSISQNGPLGLTRLDLSVTDSMRAPHTQRDGLVEKVARLRRNCEHQKTIAAVHNVQTLPELYLVKAHGANIISGPVIDFPSTMPCVVQALSFDEIGQRMVRLVDQLPDEGEVPLAMPSIAHLPPTEWRNANFLGQA